MPACSGCGGEARFQAVLGKDFHLRFEAIARGAERGLFYCEACAEEMLALKGPPLPA
ncbi:MAG: hypothetical protein LC624_06400 [Halobacteriales archaeon]|nr:hypothetical protein [Halobacteriales archaeon]